MRSRVKEFPSMRVNYLFSGYIMRNGINKITIMVHFENKLLSFQITILGRY